ncbi:8719_t:CDS:2 [Ambispora leptoticha]|uniref:8719_t:CDS:1 n=1 Tax=Ambispora leptoticha TaxID=144679 RepID=A0A9N8YPT8_9GLOM|nr:8719_t:CDS:2 [Ambispora leptoticha]
MLSKNYHRNKTSKEAFSSPTPQSPTSTTTLTTNDTDSTKTINPDAIRPLSSLPPAHTTFSARNLVRTNGRRSFPPPPSQRSGNNAQKSQNIKISTNKLEFSPVPRPNSNIVNGKEQQNSLYERSSSDNSSNQMEAMQFAKRRKNRVHFSISFKDFHKILEIEQHFFKGKPIVSNGRILLKEGTLLKDSGAGSILRKVFLFHDILITAEILPEYKQKTFMKTLGNQLIISLTHLHIESVNREEQKPPRYLIEVNTGKVFYSFVFDSMKERDEWFNILDEAITNRKVIVARRAKEMDLVQQKKRSNSFTFDGPLSRAWNLNGSFWVPDEDASGCMVCKVTKFGVLVRKHHCRLCGRVICWKCSQTRELIHGQEKYVRACKDCLGGDYDSNDEEEYLSGNGEFKIPINGGIAMKSIVNLSTASKNITSNSNGDEPTSSVETKRNSIMVEEKNNASVASYYTAPINASLTN